MTTTTPSDRDAADPRPARPQGPALDVATELAAHLERIALPLEIDGAAHARELRQRVLAQITTHLLPRLREAAIPTILVVGGPTGAGKSTLVNTVAGRQVTRAGVLRPTTRRPVLVVNPADAALVVDHPVAQRADVAEADGVPTGIALLDAPDLDSVDEGNRRLAVELVEAADMWLFVTTATRYGDALPWRILEMVRDRGVSIGIVLDRVATDVLDEVRRDLLRRLVESGFGSVPLFVVPDAGPLDGPLPESHVREVSQWLSLLATRSAAQGVAARTVRGVWGPLQEEVRELLESVLAQGRAAEALTEIAEAATTEVATDLTCQLADGALADGGPTTRWLALAGSRGPLEPLAHATTGFLARRRAVRRADERAAALATLRDEVGRSFTDVVGRAATRADSAVRRAWADDSDAGAALVAARTEASAQSERSDALAAAWRGWDDDVARIADAAPAPADALEGALLDDAGARTLLLLAAAGIDGALTAARRRWGVSGADAVVAQAREALDARASAVLASGTRAFTAPVTEHHDPEAVTALRLRVGELRVLAGGGPRDG